MSQITEKDRKVLKHKLQKHVAAIAVERDALRALVQEYQDILDSVDEGQLQLESAVDTLSQLL